MTMTASGTRPAPPEVSAIRAAFALYPSGVAAIAAMVDRTPQVFVASSFTVGVSWEPALVMLAVQRTSVTWSALRSAPRLGVSVLSADQGDLCPRLATRARDDRWSGVAHTVTASDAILVEDAALAFECEIHAEYPAGDHDIAVLEINTVETRPHLDPLVYHGQRFRTLH